MNEQGRQYELTFEDRPGYLYARVKADTVSEELALSYLREVALRCEQAECTRLMIDRDIPDMLPMSTLFFIADEFQEKMRGVRVAFVNAYPQNVEGLDFASTVGMNRGADFRIFNTATDAEKWLLAG